MFKKLLYGTLIVAAGFFGRSGSYEGPITWYHTLAVDKDENIYVGDILQNKIQKFKKIIQ